jgi:hypothetical protein
VPLHDHFRPPLKMARPWEGFHSAWCTIIVQRLRQQGLPPHHVAIPQVKRGAVIEVDVATFTDAAGAAEAGSANGGVATAVWAPPAPAQTLALDFDGIDAFEVAVYHELGGLQLVGAIELVSPANKDRPAHRNAFVGKCANYLIQGIGLMVVDVVTDRHKNLHAELLEALGATETGNGAAAADLYATAYRAAKVGGEGRLQLWAEPLAIGGPLPTLPLWIAEDLALKVELGATYDSTCDLLYIQ